MFIRLLFPGSVIYCVPLLAARHDLSITSSRLYSLRFAGVAKFKTFKFPTCQNSSEESFFSVSLLMASRACDWLFLPYELQHAFQASLHSQCHQFSLLNSGLFSTTKSWKKARRMRVSSQQEYKELHHIQLMPINEQQVKYLQSQTLKYCCDSSSLSTTTVLLFPA